MGKIMLKGVDYSALSTGIGTSSVLKSNTLHLACQGDVYTTKSFQPSVANYAELLKPWADGNPDNEDRIGYFVTIKDGLLSKAGPEDYIAGITSENPSLTGNADEEYLQENSIERKDQKEWDYVGMLGVLPVRDDGTCVPGQFCKCAGDGIATLARERSFDTYMVIERISDKIVSVVLK